MMFFIIINNVSLISTLSWPPSLGFPFRIHFNTSVALDIPFSLIIHPFPSALLIFLLFFSCLTVRTLAQDSTHAFNLGASLQLRNFPPSPRSAHMLADGRRESARGVRLLPSFTTLLWQKPVYLSYIRFKRKKVIISELLRRRMAKEVEEWWGPGTS